MTFAARIKHVDDLDPKLVCCDGMRRSVEKIAGAILQVNPSATFRKRIRCGCCGTVHELSGVRLARKFNNSNVVAVDFVDIDEGGFSTASGY